jgi:hypothetical protein
LTVSEKSNKSLLSTWGNLQGKVQKNMNWQEQVGAVIENSPEEKLILPAMYNYIRYTKSQIAAKRKQ